MTRKTKIQVDVYTRVTDKIVAELEKGVRPWMKPWSVKHAVSTARPITASTS